MKVLNTLGKRYTLDSRGKPGGDVAGTPMKSVTDIFSNNNEPTRPIAATFVR
jgi:hypothetical protein